MMEFTIEEINLMCIYDTGTRQGLMDALKAMYSDLLPEEAELRQLTENVLARLNGMTDDEYAQMQESLIPAYDE
jgi:hypothetical protein